MLCRALGETLSLLRSGKRGVALEIILSHLTDAFREMQNGVQRHWAKAGAMFHRKLRNIEGISSVETGSERDRLSEDF